MSNFSFFARHLDHHLLFPLLEHEEKIGSLSKDDHTRAVLELLSHTDMADFAMDKYKELHGVEDVPQEMKDRRVEILSRVKALPSQCEPLIQIANDAALVKQLKADKLLTLPYLAENYQVTEAHVDSLYDYAKSMYECGQYQESATFLPVFRALTPNSTKAYFALWGMLASEILLQKNWDIAYEHLLKLKEALDSKQLFQSQVLLLQHRTWFIHWSLFVFFEHPHGRNFLIDILMQERYLQTIQCDSPHILRYLAAAVIVNKRRRTTVMPDVVRIIQQEHEAYHDPITEFLECVLVKFDFEGAQLKLRECETVLKNDYFLEKIFDDFIDSARLLMFKTYCQIHQTINIAMLAEKLNMKQDEAELWIANLIRNAGFDARIDAETNHVVMGTHQPSVYQQVIEKTKGLAFRTFVLTNNIERRFRGHDDRRH